MWLALFISVYSYFALGFDDDPDSCIANENVDENHKLEKSELKHLKSYDDVGADMRFGFRWLLVLVLLELLGFFAIRYYFVMEERKWKVRMFLQRPVLLAQAVAWVYLFVVRFKETGSICSGAYLEDQDSDRGYLLEMGLFIKFMFLI